MERFIGVLIEHCNGKFPLWLTPEQYAILPISDRFADYAKEVETALAAHDIRGFIDDRSEKIGRKIRDAEVKRIPLMLIVGEQEAAEGKVSVRLQGEENGDKGAMTIEEFVVFFKEMAEA
jgi:threonyl-tRNA synthetase